MHKKLKTRKRGKDDCKRIKKALDKASEETLNMLVQQFLWHLGDHNLTLRPIGYKPENDRYDEKHKKSNSYDKYLEENDPYGRGNEHIHSFELPFMSVLHEALYEVDNLCSGDVGTLRQQIGQKAKEIFDTCEFDIGTSKTGIFVNYLNLVSEASGFKFDAHSVARTTLQS